MTIVTNSDQKNNSILTDPAEIIGLLVSLHLFSGQIRVKGGKLFVDDERWEVQRIAFRLTLMIEHEISYEALDRAMYSWALGLRGR